MCALFPSFLAGVADLCHDCALDLHQDCSNAVAFVQPLRSLHDALGIRLERSGDAQASRGIPCEPVVKMLQPRLLLHVQLRGRSQPRGLVQNCCRLHCQLQDSTLSTFKNNRIDCDELWEFAAITQCAPVPSVEKGNLKGKRHCLNSIGNQIQKQSPHQSKQKLFTGSCEPTSFQCKIAFVQFN